MRDQILYFGCPPGHRPGHGIHPHRKGCWNPADYGLPWAWEIDKDLAPKSTQEQGAATLHHKDGWTALAWWDYRGDSRPGSNSAVFIPRTGLTFDEAEQAARDRFGTWVPEVLEVHP